MTAGPHDDVDPTWTPAARAVLERACARHGGWERWRALDTVTLTFAVLRGGIPWLKGVGRSFPMPTRVVIAPHARRTVMERYPDDAHDGVFANGTVALRRRADGTLVPVPGDARAAARGHWRWTPADALYFFGYALAHYHALPFTLGAARLLAARVVDGHDVLAVELPADLPTHCRRQRFWLDGSGLLVRHDYHAEVVGRWARGAHLWRRHREVAGIPIAMERHVVPAFGDRTVPVAALHAELGDAAVACSARD